MRWTQLSLPLACYYLCINVACQIAAVQAMTEYRIHERHRWQYVQDKTLMEQIDFQRFVSAGYFLIRAGNPGWEQLQTELLPTTLLSLSQCIAPRFDVAWRWIPGNKQAALDFGVAEADWDEFVHWCGYEYASEMDVWSMFYTPDSARHLAQWLLGDTTDLHLIGAGLPRELESAHWREPVQDSDKVYGIEKRVKQRLPIADGGRPLGFDVVSFSYSNFAHSWLCSSMHVEMYNLYNIRPGMFGLLETEADAKRINDWIVEDDMRGHRAEPEPYDYWLLIEYPLDLM